MNPSEIKSAQFLDTYFPIVDGVVQAVHNYASIMNRDGYACVVVPKNNLAFDDKSLPYDVFRTKSLRLHVAEYSVPMPKFDRSLSDFLQSRKIDIFHAHSPFTEGGFASSFAKQMGIPSVATFHSKYYDDTVNITGSKTIAKIVTNHIVKFYESVDSVWSVSEGAAQTLRNYGFRGDIVIMENGTTYTEPDNPDDVKKRAAETFDIPNDKKILLFVGHQIWHKNLKLILDTFRLLCNNSDEYRLLIVGDGYDGEKIREYAQSLRFKDGRVRFLGKIADRELLMGVYLSSDLFFFPSVYDTSGLVVREAASLGVAPLLTEGSNAAEAVTKDVSGFTAAENKVAMYKEIVKIFSTDGLLEKVSAGAKREIPKTWEELMVKVREQYAGIIEKYHFEHR